MTLDITYTEVDQGMIFPPGLGGSPIVVIASDGTSGSSLTVGDVYLFNTPQEAAAQCNAGGDLLNYINGSSDGTIKGVFNEGGQYGNTQALGINMVYAIPIPTSATADDYTAAIALAENLPNMMGTVEIYPKLSDSTILASLSAHFSNMAGYGDVRVGVATVVTDAEISAMNTEIENLTTDRLAVTADPTTTGILGTKIGCTIYSDDPAKGAYRSNPTIMNWTGTDLHNLRDDAICADFQGINGPQPYMVVTPAYKSVSGVRSTAGLMHSRRNMDQHILQLFNYAAAVKYTNNTQDARNNLQTLLNTYFNRELQKQTIEDFTVNVLIDNNTPFGLSISLYVRVTGAIYQISISGNMLTPTGYVVTVEGD
jgi:hypothetical protein